MPRPRGATLPEVLIGATISLLLMTSAFQFFNGGAVIYFKGQSKVDLQSAGLVALAKLGAELRQTAVSTLTIASNPASLAFQPPASTGTSPTVFTPAQSYVLYYYSATTKQLVRKTWPAATGETVTLNPNPLTLQRRLLPTEVASIIGGANGTEVPIAGSVIALTLTPAAYPDPTLKDVNVTAALQMQTVFADNSVFTENLSDSIAMRNKP